MQVHDREHAQDKSPDAAAERAPAAAPQVPAALALQRKIGNRAFGRLVARATPEESVELLDPAINGAHVDVEQISRTFLPFSKDQEGFDTMAKAYETKMEMPLKDALGARLGGEELLRGQQARPVERLPRAGGRRRRRRRRADAVVPALGCRAWELPYRIPSARWSRRRATTTSRASCVS